MEDKKLHPNHRIRREANKNLRNYYTIFLEIGLILALLILTVLTKIHLTPAETEMPTVQEQEAVVMEEIVQTKQVEKVPPPPRPPVPVAVPNDEIIENVNIDISADLDFSTQLDLPPAPPKQADDSGNDEDEEDFFVLVEQMPELIGGLGSLQKQIKYPENAIRANIEGRVYIRFIVNEKGEVVNPTVIRGIGAGCDEEALRVVKKAKFRPGLQRGRPVRVQYNLPVIFKLQT